MTEYVVERRTVSFDESASSSAGWGKEGVGGREGGDACGGLTHI